MPAFDDYLPEELEPHTRELATLLEYLHQQPASVAGISASEQERILTRARQRLLNPDANASAEKSAETRSPLVLLESSVTAEEWAWQEDAYGREGYRAVSEEGWWGRKGHRSIHGEHLDGHGQRSSILRVFNAIAAILIVGALIAGSVILFTRQASLSAEGGGSNSGVSIPADPLPCFLNPYADDGLINVCQKHLYQDLNIVGKKGKYAVILTRAYADSNRVAVSVRLEELLDGRYTPTIHSVVDILDLKNEQGLTFGLISGIGQGTATDDEIVAWYAVPPASSTASTLHLQLDTQVTPQLRNGIVPAKDIVNMPLHFTVAMHPESRTIAINQTIVVDGVPMTIKDMRLSLSEVFFDATYDQDLSKAWPSASNLTIGKTHCGSTNDNMPTQPDIYKHINWPQLVVPSVVIAFGCPLYQAHGQAQLVLKPNDSNKTIATFRFTVPALA